MKVTREVIYDLLPSYFANEVSGDTRAMVDEFLQQDPEFARMMERFRIVFRQRSADGIAPGPESQDKDAFERARTFLEKRSELRGYVIAFGLATLCVLFVPLITARPMRVGLWAIAAAFAATSAISGVMLYRLNAETRGVS